MKGDHKQIRLVIKSLRLLLTRMELQVSLIIVVHVKSLIQIVVVILLYHQHLEQMVQLYDGIRMVQQDHHMVEKVK